MKNIYATVLFTAIYSSCFAQVIVNGSNFIQAGSVLNYQTSDASWSADQELININGENAVWNAEDWILDAEDSVVYTSLDEMSGLIEFFFNNESLYPEHYSTHALELGAEILDLPIPIPIDISDGRTYFRTDETGYYGTGLSFSFEEFQLATQNELVERIYKFPMHYADIDTSALSFLISLPGLGAYGQYADRYSEVDGQGTLITPFGTYEVLRVRSERYITDTLYVEQFGDGQNIERPLQIDYAWISPQMPGPILEISVVEDAVISARMLVSESTISVFNPDKQDLEIYPNPARDFIEFNSPFAEKATVEIYDTHSRLVLKINPIGNRIQLNTLAPGMYVVKISRNGNNTLIGKFLIIE